MRVWPLQSFGTECLISLPCMVVRHEISGPLEYHIQIFPSSLYVVPFNFKPVFICVQSENADENWLENERNHIQGRRKSRSMIFQRSRYFMSDGCQSVGIGCVRTKGLLILGQKC